MSEDVSFSRCIDCGKVRKLVGDEIERDCKCSVDTDTDRQERDSQ